MIPSVPGVKNPESIFVFVTPSSKYINPEYPGSIFVRVISTLSWFVNLSAFDSPRSE